MAIGTILVGRFLGPELYGQYTLALVAPTLLLSLADLGLNEGLIRYVANLRAKGEEGRAKQIISHGLILRMTVGLIVFTASFLLASSFANLLSRPGMTGFIQLASISLVFQVLFTATASASVGFDKSEYAAFITSMNALAKTVLSVVLVLFSYGVTGALIGYVGGYIVASITGLVLVSAKMRALTKNLDSFTQNAKELVAYGFPLYISLLMASLLPLYQNLILAFFTTDTIIGNFRSAGNFVTLITVLSVPITTALLASFSKLDSSSAEKMTGFFKIATKYMCIIIVPVTTIIIVFSKEIINIVYGSSYQFAPLFLSLSCLSYFLVAIGSLTLTSLFNGLGQTRLTFRVTLVGFVVLLVLSPIMIMPWGVPGMIIASLSANTISALYALHNARRKFKIQFSTTSILKIYLISVASSIVPILLVYLTAVSSPVKFGAGVFLYLLAYLTLLPLTKTLTFSEIQKVKDVTGKTRILALVTRPFLVYMEKLCA
jgi:O-antigen/teichoic acid export membrane protein